MVVNNQVDSQGQPTITMPMRSNPIIEIDKDKLQKLWLKGIVNDLTYIALALELHDKATLNLQQFMRDWSVDDLSDSQKDEGLKPKAIKMRSILTVICVLDAKGMADCNFSVQVNQLSLFDQCNSSQSIRRQNH